MHYTSQRRNTGISWILTFAALSALTVTTCMHQEKLLAAHAPIIVAMQQ